MDINETNKNTIEAFLNDLRHYYIGRATPMLLDGVKVEYYGEMVPIYMCGSISVPSYEMLVVNPYEKSMIKEIEKAIHKANLGLNPKADSETVKVYLPKKTKEDDKKIFKLIQERAEQAKISIRQNRQKARDTLGDITEDDRRKEEKYIQTETDDAIEDVDNILENKKKELKL